MSLKGGGIVRTIGNKSIKTAKESIRLTSDKGDLTFNAGKKVIMNGRKGGVQYLNDFVPSSEGQKCSCKISKKADSFVELITLIKQAEEMLILNGYTNVGDRISIIRGIYYGTEWSLDYNIEKSKARNTAFDTYTGSSVKADAREKLKCSENCRSNLFKSLYDTPEVFDNTYKAVDFGHLIIGLDSRRSWRSKKISLGHGGTGLEMNTWVGDLGGGTANLSSQRISNSKKRAKTIFPVGGHSYGSMVNLEGDIAAYVAGMNINNPNDISDPTNNFTTIHEILKDYFDNKWSKRAFYFLAMIGAKVDGNIITYVKNDLIKNCAEKFEDFATPYLALRKPSVLMEASNHFKPVSEEVASIFIDGLLHVVTKPEDMITARTDPDPKPKVITVKSKISNKAEEIKKKMEEYYNEKIK